MRNLCDILRENFYNNVGRSKEVQVVSFVDSLIEMPDKIFLPRSKDRIRLGKELQGMINIGEKIIIHLVDREKVYERDSSVMGWRKYIKMENITTKGYVDITRGMIVAELHSLGSEKYKGKYRITVE